VERSDYCSSDFMFIIRADGRDLIKHSFLIDYKNMDKRLLVSRNPRVANQPVSHSNVECTTLIIWSQLELLLTSLQKHKETPLDHV